MGCTTSKLDDLPAVALCRDRCTHLDEAIRQRYALAQSHLAYIHSLKEIGFSLDRFFDQHLIETYHDDSPLLHLPPHTKGPKGDPSIESSVPAPAVQAPSSSSPPPHHSNSHSDSGSHLHFHSDSDDDDDDGDSGSLHHSGNSSPLHHYNYNYDHQHDETLGGGGGGGGFMHMNYMRNRSRPSVLHEQRPMSPETVHMGMGGGGGGSYYSSNDYNYPQQQENPNPNPPYPYYNKYPPQTQTGHSNNYPPPASGYSNYGNYGFLGSPPQYNSPYPPPPAQSSGASSSKPPPPPPYGNYGFLGSPPQYNSPYPPPPAQSSGASSSKPPPPPPSPPRASAWDFLNLFETAEKYYPQNTPSRDSREVREEEGIPDLEDENYENEVVKEVHGEQKFNDGGKNHSKGDENEKRDDAEVMYEAGPSRQAENKGMEHEVHLVDKNVVANEERSEDRSNVSAFKARPGGGWRGVSEVIREIKSQFDRASESGIEVSRILEAGRVPYPQKNAVYQVSSKMLHSITPSLPVVSSQPSTSNGAEASSSTEPVGPVYLDFNGEMGARSRNLSSTLQKLYIWEKKLYDEVKAEEKTRIVHERKCRRLKHLDERGAEAHKIDSTRTLVRNLSTKIRIAIQVVDKISVKINKLRDEELWPQINELISGLIIMWKVMLECHQNQCHAIAEVKNLDAITSNKKFNGDIVAATMQLEHELLNWISNFISWVGSQKGYVRALNSWLMKCLLYEPEDTVDGPAPFSPGRYGAPPVFVICNQWSQAMERISEKEVIDAMRSFMMSVHQLLERHGMEVRQRMLTNRDMERQAKALERDEHKMQKEWQAIDKKMVLVSGQGIGLPGQMIHQSDATSSLQSGLKQIFEAMERFSASSMQAYEELRIRVEEVSRDNPKVS